MKLAILFQAIAFVLPAAASPAVDAHALQARDPGGTGGLYRPSPFIGKWTTWRQIDSGITPNLKLHPKCKIAASWSHNFTNADLYATDATGAVYTAAFSNTGGDWRGWWPIHAETKFAVGSSVTALWQGDSTRVNLFATAADGAVWSTYSDGGSSAGFVPWFPVHSEVKFGAGAPVTALARDEGHMDLFVSDASGAIWSTYWDATEGGGWHNWFLIDAGRRMGEVATIGAVWLDSSRIDLFAKDSYGTLWWSFFKYDGQGWRPWSSPFESSPAMMHGAFPVTVWYREGELNVLCVDRNGKIRESYYISKWSGWLDPFTAGYDSPTFVEGSGLSLATTVGSAGRSWAGFMVDDQANIVRLSSGAWQTGEWWNGWFLVPKLDHLVAGQYISAIQSKPLHIDLFVVKTDGTVWNLWYDETAKN